MHLIFKKFKIIQLRNYFRDDNSLSDIFSDFHHSEDENNGKFTHFLLGFAFKAIDVGKCTVSNRSVCRDALVARN